MALVLLAAPASLRAESTRPGLNWVRLPGAEQCIGWRELGEQVEARLGRTLFQGPTSADLSLDGHIAPRAGGGFVARLAVIDREGKVLGERVLETAKSSCRELDASVVLVIAVTIDPNSRLLDAGIPLSPEVAERLDRMFRDEPAEPTVPADSRHTAASANGRVARSAVEQTRPKPASRASERSASDTAQPARWAIAVMGVTEAGLLPSFSPGLAARIDLQPGGPWLFAFDGHWVAPSQAELPGAEPGRVNVRLLGTTLAACLGDTLGPVAGFVCSGARLDFANVEPQGFVMDRDARNDVWLSAQLGGSFRWPARTGVYATAGLHLLVPLVVRNYKVFDSEGVARDVLRPGPVAGRIEIGLGFRP